MNNSIVRLIIMVLGSLGAYKLTESVDFKVDTSSYIFGIVVAGFIGLVIFKLTEWSNTITRMFQPQMVFLKTTETPFQIVVRSIIALLAIIILLVIIGYLVYR